MIRILGFLLLFLVPFCNLVAAGEIEDMVAKAEQGDSIDQYDLGVKYFFGNDVPQDYKQAYIWLSVAAKNGDDEAVVKRDKCVLELSPEALKEAQTGAIELDSKIKLMKARQ